MRRRFGLRRPIGFLVGSWTDKFSLFDRSPSPEKFQKYVYELYKKNRSYWQPFILGVSSFSQSEIDSMPNLWHRVFLEALSERMEYENKKLESMRLGV